jgi:hypothetical protein
MLEKLCAATSTGMRGIMAHIGGNLGRKAWVKSTQAL